MKELNKEDINQVLKCTERIKSNKNSEVSKDEIKKYTDEKNNLVKEWESLQMGKYKAIDKEKYKEEKAEKIKELSNNIEEGIKELYDSEKYIKYLKVLYKFHKYSINNSIAIAMQKPEATIVAGFKTWNSVNRHVKMGEKGIKILAPAPIKMKFEQYKKDENGNYVCENGKKVKEEVEEIIPKYKVAYVFDISQTDGEPLPTLSEELKGNVNDYNNFKRALEGSTSFKISYGSIEGEAKGYCIPSLKK